MHFGLGAHPGFRVPLQAGERFEDYRLHFMAPCYPRRIGFTENCYLDGIDQAFLLKENQYLPLTHSLFDEDAIVLKDVGHRVTLESTKSHRKVTIEFPGMEYLGLWHCPKTNAPYICIEPWCSLPATDGTVSVFEEQKDLLSLPAGETYHNTWQLSQQKSYPNLCE